MTLDPNSLLGRYYRWMFRGKLPNDFCTLFWNMLLGVLFLPITFIVWPVSLLFRSDGWNAPLAARVLFIGPFYWILFFTIPTIGLSALKQNFGIDLFGANFWVAMAVGWLAGLAVGLAIVLGFGSIVLIAYGFYCTSEQYKEDRRLLRELQGDNVEPPKLRVLWDTIRNKYCTKIEWKPKFKIKDVSNTD